MPTTEGIFHLFFVCAVILSPSCCFGDNWNNDHDDDVQTRLKQQYESLTKQSRLNTGYRSPSASIKGAEPDFSDHHENIVQNQIGNFGDSGTKSKSGSTEFGHDGNDDSNIRIAVQSKRKWEFVPAHFDREDQRMPRMIEIVSDTMPLRLHFKSQSAALVVSQSHMSPPMKPIDETVTVDEPFRLSHKAYKPIVQEVREIIQPYRNIVQHLKPVIEDIRTIVPQDNDVNHVHASQGNGWNHKGQTGVGSKNSIFQSPADRFQQQRQQYQFDQVKTSETAQHRVETKVPFPEKPQNPPKSFSQPDQVASRPQIQTIQVLNPQRIRSNHAWIPPRRPMMQLQPSEPSRKIAFPTITARNDNGLVGDLYGRRREQPPSIERSSSIPEVVQPLSMEVYARPVMDSHLDFDGDNDYVNSEEIFAPSEHHHYYHHGHHIDHHHHHDHHDDNVLSVDDDVDGGILGDDFNPHHLHHHPYLHSLF